MNNAELLVVDSSPETGITAGIREPGAQGMDAFAGKAAFTESAAGQQDWTGTDCRVYRKRGRIHCAGLSQTLNRPCGRYGVDAQTAAFFMANGIEVTEKSLQALRQFVEGNTAGKAIAKAAQFAPAE
jgi:hypothetical protein